MEQFGFKDIVAIWGAVTGTIGTIIAIYVWRFNRRSLTPAIRFLRMSLKILESSDRGLSLFFTTAVANQSNVPSTLERVEIDLGKKLNNVCDTWERYDYPSRFLRLTHNTKSGPAGGSFEKPHGEPADYNKPLMLQANSIAESLYLRAQLYVKKDAADSFVDRLKKNIQSGEFRIIGYLPNGSFTTFEGKAVVIK